MEESEPRRHSIELETLDGGTVTLVLEGRKLVGVSNRVELSRLIAKTPVTTREGSPVGTPKVNILTFFGTGPCPYPGCEELREKYRAELKRIGGAKCTDCAHSALVQKYIPLVQAEMAKGG